MKCSVIIPCYNEEDNIRELVRSLERCRKGCNIEWIMVENGSRDGTRAALEKACCQKENFKLVYVNENKGYGYGLLQGMKQASGEYIGWIHADMQISPSEIVKFAKIAEQEKDKRLFLKGRRKNRRIVEYFFTNCMTLYASIMLKTWIYDIGAVPVLFHRSLTQYLKKAPYDFSIDTYVYMMAKKAGFVIKRCGVRQRCRKGGQSSWNKGLLSRFRQSGIIMKDILLIKRGKWIK